MKTNGYITTRENYDDDQADIDIEEQLLSVRNTYSQMKKDRLKAEKDSKLLQNKLRLLQHEELRAFKKFQKEQKYQQEYLMAMKRVLEFKESVKEKKLKQQEEVQQKQEKNQKLKQNITVSLHQSKKIKLEQNKLNAAQVKLKKIVQTYR
jgi:hypothetical protein